MIGPRGPRLLAGAGRVLLLAVYALPLLVLLLMSFKSDDDITADPAGLVFTPTLEAYRAVGDEVGPALLNSAQIAIGTTLLTVVLAVPAAYGLARRRTRTWTLVTTGLLGAVIVLQMVPQPMAVIPLYAVLAQIGVINSLFGVILADTALLLPFAILLLRPFLLAVPVELEEAAILDGASMAATFGRVVIPVARNGILTVSVMVFMLSWGEFLYAITLLTTAGGYPVSGLLAAQVSLYGTDWGRLMALAVLTTLPILVVFLLTRRQLAAGMLSGALK